MARVYNRRFKGWHAGAFAIACVSLAFVLRLLQEPRLEGAFPYTTFTAATVIVAWFCGWRMAAFAHATGMLLGWFIFAESPEPFESVWGLSFNALVGATVCAFTAKWESSSHQVERELSERRAAEEALRNAQERLARYADDLEEQVATRTEELRAALASLRTFTYGMVHNMRAPLRAISAYSRLLGEDAASRDSVREHTSRMHAAATHMDALIAALTRYSDVVTATPEPENIDVPSAIQFAIRSDPVLKAHEAAISVDAAMPKVRADPKLLRETLTQLLLNAVKFVPPDRRPQVRVTAEQNRALVHLRVEDNGTGIPSEYQHKIFELFEQLHPPGTYSGTGAGLAIARQAVQRMGGQIGMNSTPGHGSVFWIELPAA